MKLETELSLLSSVVAKRGEVDQHMQALLFMWAQKERGKEPLVLTISEKTRNAILADMRTGI